MSLPGENLSLIVKYAIQDPYEFSNTISGKRSIHGTRLSLLSGFSLASQKFRQIALREVFRTYHVHLPCHLHDLDQFRDVYRWVRVLHCPVNIAVQATEQHYAKFVFLRSVSLHGGAFGVIPILQRLPTSVQELSLPFDHANDHTTVLTSISRFHNLRFLRVMSSHFEVPPVPLKDCGDVPPHHYNYSTIAAQLLKPLSSLQVLQIDHYLTDMEVSEFHTTRCPWNNASTAFCPTCWDRYGEQTANAEVTCTEIMARGLLSLQAVLWKSWFTLHGEGHSRVFIHRSRDWTGNQTIRIRRERDTIEANWVTLRGRQKI